MTEQNTVVSAPAVIAGKVSVPRSRLFFLKILSIHNEKFPTPISFCETYSWDFIHFLQFMRYLVN